MLLLLVLALILALILRRLVLLSQCGGGQRRAELYIPGVVHSCH